MSPQIAEAFTFVLAMIGSLTVHEASHAWAAKQQGDTTAESQGRLTLNPIPHIDPIGTILLPVVGVLSQLPVFGWAKPVPVDPRQMRHRKWSYIWVAAAGPVSNLVLCAISVFYLQAFEVYLADDISPEHVLYPLAYKLAHAMMIVNAILAVFNLVPLPPLDGGTVIGAVLPLKWADAYERRVAPYGIWVLWLLMLTGGLGWVWTGAVVYLGILQALAALIIV